MRIVAGTYKGRTIVAPEGKGTRPTTDRVREALFSAIISRRGGLEGSSVLDAFAGSGACGLEAVSRGASHACLCDSDAKAIAAIKANVAALGLAPSQASVRRCDVMKSAAGLPGAPFDAVFLDPPYALDPSRVGSLLAALRDGGALAEGAIIAYEHEQANSEQAVTMLQELGFADVACKRYGKSSIAIARAE